MQHHYNAGTKVIIFRHRQEKQATADAFIAYPIFCRITVQPASRATSLRPKSFQFQIPHIHDAALPL